MKLIGFAGAYCVPELAERGSRAQSVGQIELNNLSNIFHELISIDAWRSEFDNNRIASVHVDLSFSTAMLGSEEGRKVSFKLSLKRATLKVVIPPTEPLAAIQSSIDREPTMEGIKRVIQKREVDKLLTGGASGALGTKTAGRLEGAASGKLATQEVQSVEFEQMVGNFNVRQLTDRNRNHFWEINEANGKVLTGKVWDPVRRPRLKVKAQTDPSKMPPSCNVIVACRRSDFDIDEIKFKSGRKFALVTEKNKVAAAEAVIRKKLEEHGLVSTFPDGEYVEIVLANMIVIEETK